MGTWHLLGKVAGLSCWPLEAHGNLQILFANTDHLCFDRTTYDNINGPGRPVYARHNCSGQTTYVLGPNILLQAIQTKQVYTHLFLKTHL